LSHDERSLSRRFVAPDGRAALAFFQAVSELAATANHPLPDLHLTQGCHVEVVLTAVGGLSTQDIHLARAIDALPIAMAPAWRSAQTIDASDAAVSFDTAHYTTGPNGFFLQDDAIEAFEGIFENTEMRDIAASKEEIVKALRIAPGAVVADIGAGTGLLEPLLSAAVGTDGKVLCSEISPKFCERIRERCQDLDNVVVVDGPTDRDPKLPSDGTVDLVLLVDVYHHLEFPQTVLRHIRASLQRHGALVVIDFHRDPARIQSHGEDWVFQHLRADQATFTKEIEKTGFIQVDEVDVPGLPENYFLVFRKRPLALAEPGVGWTC
jgi:SAM-dependent methyltransferase/pterin-4a-carbinolamine dehydratase